MGLTALLPLRRKCVLWIFITRKNPPSLVGMLLNPTLFYLRFVKQSSHEFKAMDLYGNNFRHDFSFQLTTFNADR
jgi:hypothetical protein